MDYDMFDWILTCSNQRMSVKFVNMFFFCIYEDLAKWDFFGYKVDLKKIVYNFLNSYLKLPKYF